MTAVQLASGACLQVNALHPLMHKACRRGYYHGTRSRHAPPKDESEQVQTRCSPGPLLGAHARRAEAQAGGGRGVDPPAVAGGGGNAADGGAASCRHDTAVTDHHVERCLPAAAA